MKHNNSPIQVGLDLDPGLLDVYPEFKDAVRASVYSCGRAFKAIAADMDMSVSELSRKLADNPNDPVHFPLNRLPDLMRATGDMRPMHWLIATFIESAEAKKHRAIDQLTSLLPQIHAALKNVNG